MIDFQGYITELKLVAPEGAESEYPFNIPALKNFKALKFHPKVTYFVGENGMGKSTLLEAIAIYCGFNAEGGSRHFNFSSKASHSNLHEHIRMAKGIKQMRDGFFLRSESFYNVASEIDLISEDDPEMLKAYGDVSLHEQSHGESFWALFMNRFKGNGLYILDEPESALSVNRQMAMLSKIHELSESHSQFIIATHSPVVLAYPDSIIYQFSDTGLKKINYKETETYTVFREFLNHPEEMLSILLNKRN
eukprot:gene17622-21018_t